MSDSKAEIANNEANPCASRGKEKPTLLTLPPELRSRIWKFVFSATPKYEYKPAQRPQAGRVVISHSPLRSRTTSVLAALLTCRQIQHEAWHLFYSVNLLSLSSPAQLFHFLRSLRPAQRESITALHVANLGLHWTSFMAARSFSLLTLCPSLRRFYLDFAPGIMVHLTDTLAIVASNDRNAPILDGAIHQAIAVLHQLRGLEDICLRAIRLDGVGTLISSDKGSDSSDTSSADPDWPLTELDVSSLGLKETVTRPRPRGLATRLQRARSDRNQDRHKRSRATHSEDDGDARKVSPEASLPTLPASGDQCMYSKRKKTSRASRPLQRTARVAHNWEATSDEDEGDSSGDAGGGDGDTSEERVHDIGETMREDEDEEQKEKLWSKRPHNTKIPNNVMHAILSMKEKRERTVHELLRTQHQAQLALDPLDVGLSTEMETEDENEEDD